MRIMLDSDRGLVMTIIKNVVDSISIPSFSIQKLESRNIYHREDIVVM